MWTQLCFDAKRLMIGVDLGGSKIGFGLVKVEKGDPQTSFRLVDHFLVPTFENHEERKNGSYVIVKKIKHGVQRLVEIASKYGENRVEAIGIGSPGRIINGKILSQTAPFLGDGIDDFDLKSALEKEIECQVYLQNDAISQMIYSVLLLITEKVLKIESLNNDPRIGYIGPGTGLGGGFARFKLEGKYLCYEVFTDGHIGDLVIEGKEAESELLSGTFIKEEFGLTGIELNEALIQNQKLEVANILGDHLGKIVEVLHEGRIRKSRDTTKWDEADVAAVKGMKAFIIGGSVASKGKLGETLVDRAAQYLKERDLSGIKLYSVPINSTQAGIMGAAIQSVTKTLD